MAKGGHRRPTKGKKKTYNKEAKSEVQTSQRSKSRKKQVRKSKTLLRQMRGMKWDEDEYSDEIEELDDLE